MKLTYNDQTVELFPLSGFPNGPPDRILVNVSGGLDSAALLYLLCKHYPSMEKHIYTGKDLVTPFDSEAAIDVVSWCKDNFANHNILTHDIIVYDDRDPEVLQEVHELVKTDPSYYDKYAWVDFPDQPERSLNHFLGKIAKPYLMGKTTKQLVMKYNCTKYIAAMTQNPPTADMEALGFDHLAEQKRNEGREDVAVVGGLCYHPFARVNKKFVQGVFEQEDLMGEYFSLTGSCTGTALETNYFQEPCKQCFWCHERHWAFGSY